MRAPKDIAILIREVLESAPTAAVLRSDPPEFVNGKLVQLVCTIGETIVPGFAIDNDNRIAYLAASFWACGLPFHCASGEGDNTRGLYIAGPTGSGKTVLTKVVRRLAEVVGSSVKTFGNVYQLGRWMEARADEIVADYARTGDLTGWVDAPILCVQDLGSEPREALYMGNRAEPLRQLVERRADRDGGMLVVTSNLLPTHLGDKYGDRVASRVPQMCNLIVMAGHDRRRKFNL